MPEIIPLKSVPVKTVEVDVETDQDTHPSSPQVVESSLGPGLYTDSSTSIITFLTNCQHFHGCGINVLHDGIPLVAKKAVNGDWNRPWKIAFDHCRIINCNSQWLNVSSEKQWQNHTHHKHYM